MRFAIAVLLSVLTPLFLTADESIEELECDLLIVGGTESGCAAAVQAARAGIERIVLVNDIEWLGGQFSAEGLGAIDENRAHGYDGTVPIPRSGIFLEVIHAIEDENARRYGGERRPGNTRVITTAQPLIAEHVFREILKPYEATGQLVRYSHFRPDVVEKSGNRVAAVGFQSTKDPHERILVRARLTIDASDWGDVIRLSGADYDFGIDAREEYGEPSAPKSAEPSTDLNPITWCMILVEQTQELTIEEPAGYDEANFQGQWGWIDSDFAYGSRRLVDGEGFETFRAPDVVLINNPNVDYPLDEYPARIVAQLEATEHGASTKSIIEMSHEQREIVFADARLRSLQYLYYLQSNFPAFRKMALSTEFGTDHRLPPKPYIRESLRLQAQYVIREQDVLGAGSQSNYAMAMFPDAMFSWQFELDFHPTQRHWLSDRGNRGPWEAAFRGKRRFGNGGTGLAVFPLRSFVPIEVEGLLGAQKNLGYSSIVSSSCRLHDQSTLAGQACGAVASIALKRDIQPREMWANADVISDIWDLLLDDSHGAPVVIWPYQDVAPSDPGFKAIQQLALRRLVPLSPRDTLFKPDEPVSEDWLKRLTERLRSTGFDQVADSPRAIGSRREVAIIIWEAISKRPFEFPIHLTDNDADNDGLLDPSDPLPFTPGSTTWNLEELKPPKNRDGIPDWPAINTAISFAIDFRSETSPSIEGFLTDVGAEFAEEAGFGWLNDLTDNTRDRSNGTYEPRHGFVFTRKQDVWERSVENGKYRVTVCLGDSSFAQPGQNLIVEDVSVANDVDTALGEHFEVTVEVEVEDGRLTLVLGKPEGGSNTTLNWLVIEDLK